jgi:hypothetical protein
MAIKQWLGVAAAIALVALVGSLALAQTNKGQPVPDGWGFPCSGMMGASGNGRMGPQMMGRSGAAQITAEKAKEVAQQYANTNVKGFTVEKVQPFTAMMGMTMYSVDLKGPNDEFRTLYVNPWGNVMPGSGPWHRTK